MDVVVVEVVVEVSDVEVIIVEDVGNEVSDDDVVTPVLNAVAELA
jgi:hypothetical protein